MSALKKKINRVNKQVKTIMCLFFILFIYIKILKHHKKFERRREQKIAHFLSPQLSPSNLCLFLRPQPLLSVQPMSHKTDVWATQSWSDQSHWPSHFLSSNTFSTVDFWLFFSSSPRTWLAYWWLMLLLPSGWSSPLPLPSSGK